MSIIELSPNSPLPYESPYELPPDERFNGVMAVVDTAKCITIRVAYGPRPTVAILWRYLDEVPPKTTTVTFTSVDLSYTKEMSFFRTMNPVMFLTRMDRGTHLNYISVHNCPMMMTIIISAPSPTANRLDAP